MKGSKMSDETIKELYASERCLNDELLDKRCMQCPYFNMRDEGNGAYARYCDLQNLRYTLIERCPRDKCG